MIYLPCLSDLLSSVLLSWSSEISKSEIKSILDSKDSSSSDSFKDLSSSDSSKDSHPWLLLLFQLWVVVVVAVVILLPPLAGIQDTVSV
jgi:hypothetical protein